MSNREDKPKLSSSQLVSKMVDEKGITIKYISEKEAEEYFQNRNNYLRTAAYRKNYQKYLSGKNKDKYIDLDFSYLQELSTIDMHLRNLISKMCFDIEHAMKVKLLHDIENDCKQNGYDIVYEFLNKNPYCVRQLEMKSKSPFTGDLISKYFTIKEMENLSGKKENKIIEYDDCPVWVLLELLSFGDFIRFYKFCYEMLSKKCISVSVINLVRNLRNGCAHNNCIISDFSHGTSRPPAEISKAVAEIACISRNQRLKKLSCRPMLEFTCMLYVYSEVVSKRVKYHRTCEIKDFFNGRMLEKKSYFKKNELIKSSFNFAEKVVNNIL